MIDLFYVPKQAYLNALKLTDAETVNATEFEIDVLLEWIKLYKIDVFSEQSLVTFNVVDYFITIQYHLCMDADTVRVHAVDCTDNTVSKYDIVEYFKKNNEHLFIYT